MGVFNTIASVQYKATMGGLPFWFFLGIFVLLVGVSKYQMKYNDPDPSKGSRNYTWTESIGGSLLITGVLALADFFRKKYHKAQTKLFEREGFTNAKAAVYQGARMDNLSARINGLNR